MLVSIPLWRNVAPVEARNRDLPGSAHLTRRQNHSHQRQNEQRAYSRKSTTRVTPGTATRRHGGFKRPRRPPCRFLFFHISKQVSNSPHTASIDANNANTFEYLYYNRCLSARTVAGTLRNVRRTLAGTTRTTRTSGRSTNLFQAVLHLRSVKHEYQRPSRRTQRTRETTARICLKHLP